MSGKGGVFTGQKRENWAGTRDNLRQLTFRRPQQRPVRRTTTTVPGIDGGMRAGERDTVSVLRAGEQLVARKFGSRNCRSLGGATEPLYLPECESWVTPVSWSLGERVTRRKDFIGIYTNCSQFGGIRWTFETSNRKRRIWSRRKMFSLK